MQEFINTFVNPEGMNRMVVYFLLLVPFIALIGTIARHFLGIKAMSLGVLLSLVYIMAFIVNDSSLYSVVLGFILVFFIYSFSYYVKRFTIDAGMHYYGRISFVLSTISILVVLILLAIYQIPYIRDNFDYSLINPFAVLLAVALGEQFSAHQIQKGIKTSRSLFLNTVILSALIGFAASLRVVETFIIANPYLVLVALFLSYFVGKYQGMRLSELFRFGAVSRNEND